MNDDRELELVPYSGRRRRIDLDAKLPQDRSADEDINAVTDEIIRSRRKPVVNLGFSRMKGRHHG